MSNLLFINNTSDIQVLRDRVRILNETVRLAKEEIEILKKHRAHEMIEANTFATMVHSLAEKLNLSKEDTQKLRVESRRLCEEDLRRRGFKQVFEKPPYLVVK